MVFLLSSKNDKLAGMLRENAQENDAIVGQDLLIGAADVAAVQDSYRGQDTEGKIQRAIIKTSNSMRLFLLPCKIQKKMSKCSAQCAIIEII
jgi:hypothetical protein